MSPEQQRKKQAAMDEAQRHAVYAAADRFRAREEPAPSRAMEAAERRCEAAYRKEERDVDSEGHSINENRY